MMATTNLEMPQQPGERTSPTMRPGMMTTGLGTLDGLGARLLDASEQVWAVTGVDLTRVLRDKLGEDGRVGVFTSEAGRKWVHVDEHQSGRRPGKPPASPPLYLHNSAKSKI